MTATITAAQVKELRDRTGAGMMDCKALAIGHPVAGDPEYGRRGLLDLPRQFLHAERLAFTHPSTGAAIDLRSPLPVDLSKALARACECE